MALLDNVIGKTIARIRIAEHSLSGTGVLTEGDKFGRDHYDGGFIMEFTDGTSIEVRGPFDEGVTVAPYPNPPAE